MLEEGIFQQKHKYASPYKILYKCLPNYDSGEKIEVTTFENNSERKAMSVELLKMTIK